MNSFYFRQAGMVEVKSGENFRVFDRNLNSLNHSEIYE